MAAGCCGSVPLKKTCVAVFANHVRNDGFSVLGDDLDRKEEKKGVMKNERIKPAGKCLEIKSLLSFYYFTRI